MSGWVRKIVWYLKCIDCHQLYQKFTSARKKPKNRRCEDCQRKFIYKQRDRRIENAKLRN